MLSSRPPRLVGRGAPAYDGTRACPGKVGTGFPIRDMRHSTNREHVPILRNVTFSGCLETRRMTRVAIAGLGAIGRVIARRLRDGLPGLTLAAVASRDAAKARAWLDAERISCPVVALEALPEHAD